MLRKITRIFFKTLGVLALLIILCAVGLYFGIQSYSFQTWLGKRATSYLSSELGSKVYVDKVNLEFFSTANLRGVFILDKHNDTLLYGDLLVDIKNFSYKKKTLTLDKITLQNTTSKLIKYKNDSVYNYQFLADYFNSGVKDTTAKQEWNIKFGDLFLDNVNFNYRDNNLNTTVTHTINFDNIGLKNTSGKISGFKTVGDTISASISNLRTSEQSGFTLSSLTTQLKISSKELLLENLRLKTPNTFVKGTIDFSYSGWGDFADFITKVNMHCELKDSTTLYFGDIASFTSELEGLNETIALSGLVKGTVSDMNLKNVKLAYRKSTKFNGNITVSGLPEIKNTFIHITARSLSTNYMDIEHIPSYPFNKHKKLELPVELKRLGTISYRGNFDGFISDFNTYGNFKTGLGMVSAQVSIKLGDKIENMTYRGKISTERFNLGTLLDQSDLNNLTMHSEITGKGIDIKTLDAKFQGEILNVGYNGYDYKNIKLNGSISDKLFKGLLVSKDQNADFDFNGTINFKNKVPEMDFISTVNNLKLSHLKLISSQDSGNISSQVFINIKGNSIDNLSGQINFDNTIYTTKTNTFNLSTFNIKMDQTTPDKNIRLTSAYINASLMGRFQANNLKPAFEVFLYNYYPTFFKKPVLGKKFSENVSFKISVKKFNTIKELFLPDLMLSPGTVVEGNFNALENKLNVQASAPKVNYKGMSGTELVLILNENNHTVIAEASGRALNLTDSMAMENFNFALNSVDKQSSYSLDWDNLKQPSNKGEWKGNIIFDNSSLNISCEKLSVTVTDSTWNLMRPNSVIVDKSGSILVNPLNIVNGKQSINTAGILSERPGDSLVIETKNVILQQFNSALAVLKLKVEGVMNGNITLSNANKKFAFDGDLSLTNLKMNNNTVGALVVKTRYNPDARFISLNGFTSLGLQDEFGNQSKNISFNGSYFLDRKDESIDVDFIAAPANLRLLNPIMEGIITINNGFVNGSGKIHGTPDKIKVDGKLRLFNSEVKVDYTNVTYNITGDIEIMPDQIRFSDLLFREKGTKAAAQGTLNGNIFHDNFSKMQLDYDINYKNMLVLNTTERENKTFYGKIYGTGRVSIYGLLNDLNMSIETTTNKNSKFILPLDGPAEISENGFIRFVKKDTAKVKKNEAITGFNLDIKVNVTPDASAQIVLDKKTGDVLNVQGRGELELSVNTLGKFEMFGDYIITSGDYLFTLENVISKKFEINPGSSISWSGNPMNADIDVVTIYKQRASVAPLLNDTTYKSRLPVECKLLITGKLFSPAIKFDIDFPNIDANARARINSVLSDEAELNRQVFSFLLFRTFVPPLIFNAGGGVTAGSAAASTGSEMLSNRVSEFFNTYFGNFKGLKDLQLGLNYRPGSQTSNEAVDLALSKQFLNNKISVDGNFGVNNNQVRTPNSSGLIGDVNVEYKLSDDGRYRLKGFNRTNDNTQLTILGGQFTQGVGFFYRKEFETWSQLFKRHYEKTKNIPKH